VGVSINLRSVDLNLLTVFEAVMNTRKLSEAANLLGMTQPAASNAVARLRLTFEDELFIRTRHGVVPTAKAEELIIPIRQALALIQDSLNDNNEFDPNTSERTFKLAVGDYGEVVLLPALLGVLSQYSGKFRIQTPPERDKQNYELVKQGLIDFYFDYAVPTDAQLDYCQVGEEELVVIARKNHPAFTQKLSKKSYLKANHVVLSFRHQQKTMLDDLLNLKKNMPRQVTAQVRQYAAIPSLVTQSDCIATLPRRMAEHYASNGAITIFPFPFDVEKNKYYMSWHKSKNRDRAHQWLKQTIVDLSWSNDH
jgi:LysR family transcriptional regulator, transcriptional activator for leuABCD operon